MAKPQRKNELAVETERDRQIIEALYRGDSRATIQDLIGLEGQEFEAVYARVLKVLGVALAARSKEETYAEHFAAGQAIISKLKKIYDTAEPRDAVSALKAEWQIQRDILKTGQDLGLVKIGTDENGVYVNLVQIQGLTSEQILAAMKQIMRDLEETQSKFGQGIGILDVDPGPIYSGPSANTLKSVELSS